ncbi:hypothetical protein ScPMuIL_004455 [Solemya velum]
MRGGFQSRNDIPTPRYTVGEHSPVTQNTARAAMVTKMRRDPPLLGALVLLSIASVYGQQSCSRIDNTGSINLNVRINEAFGNVDPTLNQDLYQVQIPINGRADQVPTTLRSINGDTIDPNGFFSIGTVSNPADFNQNFYLKMTRAVDRDGSTASTADDLDSVTYTFICDGGVYVEYNLIITFADVNDNAPIFATNVLYSTSVKEMTPIGTKLRDLTITATDLDSPLNNGRISYVIQEGDNSLVDGSSKFSIGADGILTVAGDLDYEILPTTNKFYRLNVLAIDQAIPESTRNTATQLVTVNIEDQDDQGPHFFYNGCTTYLSYCVNPLYTATVASGQVTGKLTLSGYPLIPGINSNIDIEAKDKDTLNAQLTFYLQETVPDGYISYFEISEAASPNFQNPYYTVELKQIRPIQRTTIQEVDLIIRAQEERGQRKYERCRVKVTIVPSNTNPPNIISQLGFIGYIDENSPSNTLVTNVNRVPLQLDISDLDVLATDIEPAYTMVTNNPLFAITTEGFISLTQPVLNYESTQQYTVEVIANEMAGANPLSSTATLTINVQDLNDNLPVFPTKVYYMELAPGSYSTFNPLEVLTVTATDADVGQFSTLSYRIEDVQDKSQNSYSNLFRINPNTGKIDAVGTLVSDRTYLITVRASDQQSTSINSFAQTGVIVYITKTDVQGLPYFTGGNQYAIDVSEGVLLSSSIFQMPVVDSDGDTIVYTISGSNFQETNIISEDFTVSTTGLISNLRQLDRESRPSYTVIMTARQENVFSSTATATLVITVTDINDNDPFITTFSPQFSIQENQGSTTLGTITAADQDQPGTPASTVSFGLNTFTNLFTINAQTGTISTLQPLDYESQQRYELEVIVRDGGPAVRSSTTTVTINVQDMSDSVPLFVSETFSDDVPENSPANTFVTAVTAQDMDTFKEITYTIPSNFGDATAFSIDQTNGNIYTTRELNYETKNRYVFEVSTTQAANSNILSSTATVTISVLDVNDFSPVLTVTPNTNVLMAEDAGPGSEIATLTATDNDPNNSPFGQIEYSIVFVNPSSGNNLFYVNPITGLLVLANAFSTDTASPTQYDIQVRASDKGTPVLSDTATVRVLVQRNQFSPRFVPSSQYTAFVSQTLDVGQVVTTDVLAEDDDIVPLYSTVTYSIIPDGSIENKFAINPVSGVIRTTAALLSDGSSTYVIQVLATDGGGLTAVGTVTVSVNRNLVAPEWFVTTYSYDLLENYPLTDVFLTFFAKDDDLTSPHNLLDFTITGNALALQYFAIDDARAGLYLIQSPTLVPTIDQFTLTVSLQDKGTPVRPAIGTATVTVNIIRNQAPPLFFQTAYFAEIREDVSLSTSVKTVEASDADTQFLVQFSAITYSIIGDDSAANFFSIPNPSNGLVVTSGDLRNENTNPYRVRIRASDSGSPPKTAVAMLTVTIIRNFLRPQWDREQYSARIKETQPIRSTFITVGANDFDSQAPNNDVFYELTGSTAGQEYFDINKNTGEIYPIRSLYLDAADTQQYTLTVKAYDGGVPVLTATTEVTVFITVLQNTQRPSFVTSSCDRSVSTNLNVDDPILTVQAIDGDTEQFNVITYSIASDDDESSYFKINPSTGAVTLARSIANDFRSEYKIIIMAADDGYPQKSDVISCTISLDRNQVAPIFVFPNFQNQYEFNILETQALGDVFGSVTARDTDSQNQNDVTYNLQGFSEYFTLNSNTGGFSVNSPLSRDNSFNNNQYTFFVTATDKGTPKLTSVPATVIINVVRNNFPPVFTENTYTANLDQSGTSGPIVKVSANDQDVSAPFNQITYSIIPTDVSNLFQMNPNTGDISLVNQQALGNQGEYYLMVEAKDGGGKTDHAVVILTVNQNTFPPQWVTPNAQSNYIATVQILETINPSDTVFQLEASDFDTVPPYNILVYTVMGTDNAPLYFRVNNEGRITASSLLKDTAREYTLTVQLSDGSGSTSPNLATVNIIVQRNDFGPVWVNDPYSTTISELTGVGQSVLQVTAVDSDSVNSFGRITYSLIGDGIAPSLFGINSLTGQISLTDTLTNSQVLAGNGETQYILRVQACDNGFRPKCIWTTIPITVNRNLNSPIFDQTNYQGQVADYSAFGQVVATVRATDADKTAPNNLVRYEVVGDDTFFSVEELTGDVFVKNSLSNDQSGTTFYQVEINAYDLGTPRRNSADNAFVNIQLVRNNNSPFFISTPYTITINENEPVTASSLLRIQVGDRDTVAPFNTVTVSVVGDDSGPDYFRLENDLDIVVARDLRQQTDTFYRLRLVARDGGTPPRSATALVDINVRRNLQTPELLQTNYVETIPESHSIGASVSQIFGKDDDVNSPHKDLNFAIPDTQNNQLARQYFAIESDTGLVYLRQSLFRDQANIDTFTMTITLADKGFPVLTAVNSATLTVNVVRNKNAPIFRNTPYGRALDRTTQVDQVVFTVTADDADLDAPYNTITYSIIGDDEAPNLFRINGVNGEISLRSNLFSATQDVYQIRVVAADGGTPSLSDTEVVVITVNRNFNDPQFQLNSYNFFIPENRPPGGFVGQISATDLDITSPEKDVKYYFSVSSTSFFLDQDTGTITVAQSLVGNGQDTFQLTAIATDQGAAPRTDSVPVTITVYRNRFPPVFIETPFTAAIQTTDSIGLPILRVTATDEDTQNPFNQVTYSLYGSSAFVIDRNSGQISLASDIRTDSESQYELFVFAIDGGGLQDSEKVTIFVTKNLFAPRFSPDNYVFQVPETQTLGVTIGSVIAQDFDSSAPDNVVTYTLSGDTRALNYFGVNSDTGAIFATSLLSNDPQKQVPYSLTVTATDNGSPKNPATNTASVTISVYRNNNPPIFLNTPYNADITLNTNSGVEVFRFSVIDQDIQSPYNEVTLSMIGLKNAPNLFTLEQQGNTGIVRVRSQNDLLADGSSLYQLIIYAEDGGQPPLSDTQIIELSLRKNLFAPVFSPGGIIRELIPESTDIGTVVTPITVNDADTTIPNNQFSCSLIGDGDGPEFFFVNPLSCDVVLIKSVEDTQANGYTLRVLAADKGSPSLSSTTQVEITIQRQQETLRFFSNNYQEEINENLPVGSSVIFVTASPSPGIVYTLIGQSDGPDYFDVNSGNGQITVKSDLTQDGNKKTFYTVIGVQATKIFSFGNVQTASATVEITVRRNINPPFFSEETYRRTVSETISLGTSVVQLIASDADTQDQLLYSVVEVPGVTDYFYVSPSTGLISLQSLLSTQSENQFQFEVRVSDQSSPERTDLATVIVTVVRSQFPPVFQTVPYFVNIPVTQRVDTSFYQVNAIDPDLQGTIRYGVDGYLSATGYFKIDQNGNILVRAPLQTDITNTYILGVTAYDTGYPSQIARENVTITVNRNPSAPVFNPTVYSQNVLESEAIGTSLIQLLATDADGHDVRYNIISSTSNDYSTFLLLDSSGLISIRSPLTGSFVDSYQLTIQVTDTGNPPLTSSRQAIATINIFRNKFDPVFSLPSYEIDIPETTPINDQVIQLPASDRDTRPEFSQITYQLLGDDNMPSYFSLSGSTGWITVLSRLTAENRDYYIGRVAAFDGGNPPRSATATVKINILRNLNSPIFTPQTYETTVFETSSVTTSILKVSCSDNDVWSPNRDVRYYLGQNTFASSYFLVDSVSGWITSRTPLYLDDSDSPEYRFDVNCNDLGDPQNVATQPAKVTIKVRRNQSPPRFVDTPYAATLTFNAQAGVDVYDTDAVDDDIQAPFNTLTYDIIGDDKGSVYFRIDAGSGMVRTTSQLINDNSNFYIIRVRASDGGTPSLTATATVAVTVTRNLFTPEWLQQNYTVTILDSQELGSSLLQLNARDLDVDAPYNTLVFSLTGDNDAADYFNVDSADGYIYARKSLATTSINQFVATISLRDAAVPSRRSINVAYVTIIVLRNRFAPEFINLPCVAQLGQAIGIGSNVVRVEARDDDSFNTDFGIVQYDIIGDGVAQQYFAINTFTGQITISANLAEQSVDEYKVRVRARDRQSYSTTIPETYSLGTPVLTVEARDNDPLPPHNVIRYEIVADDEDKLCFLMNEVTGELLLRQSLLFAPCDADFYSMKVRAKDLGSPQRFSSEIDVFVDVQRNENPPIFFREPYITQLQENSFSGQSVYTVTANDADTQQPFNVIKYKIIGDGNVPQLFTINEDSGLISLLTNNIGSETESSYSIRVVAADGGYPSLTDTSVVTVTVVRNLFTPQFTTLNYEIFIPETQGVGISLVKVEATDADQRAPHNVVNFEATGTGNALSYFKIEASSGDVYLYTSLLNSNQVGNRFTMTVSVSDLGIPKRTSQQTATVIINVIRNNCPFFSNLPDDLNLSPSQSTNDAIYTVNAFDNDPEGTFNTLRYDLVGDDGATVLFRIDSNSGQIFLRSQLVTDDKSLYVLRVRVEDGGNCQTTNVLRVTVNRNQLAPVWVSGNSFETTIMETHNVITTIFTLSATDNDIRSPHNIVRYKLHPDTPNENLFFVDGESGQVFLRSSLAGTNVDQYMVAFLAYDLGEPTSRQSVRFNLTVNVLRNRFPPVFESEPYSTVISRNAFQGSPVYQTTATDKDIQAPFNTLEYSVIGGNDAASYFRIDQNGQIFLLRSIANDINDQYNVQIRVMDGGNPRLFDDSVVLVTVNRNLFPPQWAQENYQQTIRDSLYPGVPILRVTATDADQQPPHNTLTFTLLDNSDLFMMDDSSGDLMLKQSVYDPNAVQPTIYNMQAAVRDNGSPQRDAVRNANIVITVLHNNFPPVFQNEPYSTIIPDTTRGDVSIYQTSATDNDLQAPYNTVTYEMVGDAVAPTLFYVNVNTGEVRLRDNAVLSLEDDSVYYVQIRAKDGGIPAKDDYATVKVTVLKNNFPPIFDNLDFIRLQIFETFTIGGVVTDVNATDADDTVPENVISYSIIGDNQAPEYFIINPQTGVIRLAKSVLQPAANFYRIQVQAKDGGSPSRTDTTFVEVTVLRDSGQLAFTLPSYSITISESLPVGQFVLTTLAQPGNPVYEVLGFAPGTDYFDLDANSGTITVRQNLRNDPDETKSLPYQLLVKASATSGVGSLLTDQATVTIIVIRNENGPIFIEDYNRATPDTTPVGTTILTVQATDADGDQIFYTMADSNLPFFLHPRSGAISLAQSVLGTSQDTYSPSDNQSPAKTDTATVTITILRDTFPPEFLSEPYTAFISENSLNSPSVYTVSARDRDIRGQLVFQAIGIGKASIYFDVDDNTGRVFISDSQNLRQDIETSYTLRLIVYDSVYPDVQDTADVTIIVSRNPNSPVCSQSSYNINIAESTSLGDLLIDVNGTDADGHTLTYAITGDERALQYYYINPQNGYISLKSVLTTSSHLTDTITVQLTDNGYPPKKWDLYCTAVYPNPVGPIRYLLDPVHPYFDVNQVNRVHYNKAEYRTRTPLLHTMWWSKHMTQPTPTS